jgi:uncharacterized protein YbaR (Trm112 family)
MTQGHAMISPELVEMLRCPLDPGRTRLELAENGLVCQRCRLKFPIKEGIPCVLIEEATLPPDCPGINALPCRQGRGREEK